MKPREFKDVYAWMMEQGVKFSGKRAQFIHEFCEYATWLEETVKPKHYLEIGSRHGESLALHAKLMGPGSHLTAIELPGAKWGREGSRDNLDKVVEGLGENHFVKVWYGNSQDPDVIELAKTEAPYDLIFIDGDHSYEGAKLDWLNYGDLGQYIVYHDVGSIHPVGEFWRKELRPIALKEFIHPQKDNKTMGIGVYKNA